MLVQLKQIQPLPEADDFRCDDGEDFDDDEFDDDLDDERTVEYFPVVLVCPLALFFNALIGPLSAFLAPSRNPDRVASDPVTKVPLEFDFPLADPFLDPDLFTPDLFLDLAGVVGGVVA